MVIPNSSAVMLPESVPQSPIDEHLGVSGKTQRYARNIVPAIQFSLM